MKERKYLTVSVLTRYLKAKFEEDEHLRVIFLKGEISNFKAHTSGHLYFSLKDETSKINAIMFKSQAKSLPFEPVDGMKVLITGRVSIYEATGNYQIYVEEMLEDGVGNLYIAFEQLKEKLSKEGLFNPERKKKIPHIPEKIGIITAPTGAAIRDILSTIKRRFPIANTYLFPSLVQGENAAGEIAKKIAFAQNYPLDVLIIGRGGGSIEDLWPFNEEIVARAIAASHIPIISAVGHEVDFTISDFVADLRAPTPTGAAEMAVPNLADLQKHLLQLKIRLQETMLQKVNYQRLYMDTLKNSFALKNPKLLYENKKQNLDYYLEKAKNIMLHRIEREKQHLLHLQTHYLFQNPHKIYQSKREQLTKTIEKLTLLNPLNVLKRGYSLSYIGSDLLSDIKQIQKEDDIKIQLYNGTIYTKVKKIEEETWTEIK